MSAEKPRRLGRGLEALIAGANTTSTASSVPPSELQRIPLSRIRPNPFQPRREFSPAELTELEASLKSSGLLQPISVRRNGDAFELIAGERRYRAATNLGWTEITAIVREFDDRTMLVLALVENLQRANLNPLEEARGYRRLLDEFQLTQQQVADAVGKDRTTVTNLLRVLTLPPAVQQMVEDGRLSTGHARALLALGPENPPAEVAAVAIERRFSVRELEQHVRELSGEIAPRTRRSSGSKQTDTPARSDNPSVRRIEDDLRRYLQTDVRLSISSDGKGKLEISVYSAEDLDRLLDLVLREQRADF
jgi:ParB family chromosome partitioning protein